MTATSATTSAAFLKRFYVEGNLETIYLKERPTLEILTRKGGLVGEACVQPLLVRPPNGVSANYQGASAAIDPSGGERFLANEGQYIGKVDFGDRDLRKTGGKDKSGGQNRGAFLSTWGRELVGIVETMSDDLSLSLFIGNGGIPMGRRASISTNTVTLLDPADARHWEIGDTIMASANDGALVTDAPRAGTAKVTAVDRTAGTITLDDQSTIVSFANNDYLFKGGNFAGNTGNRVIHGFDSYVVPETILTANIPNLWGVVRTTDRNRLAGCTVPTAQLSGTIYERITKIVVYAMSRYRARRDGLFCSLNPEDFDRLQQEAQSRGRLNMQEKDVHWGFERITIAAGGAKVTCYSDSFCPPKRARIWRRENWKLRHVGDSLFLPLQDDLQMLRVQGAPNPTYRHETVCYPLLLTDAPGYNMTGAL